jgi:hypothetical protein
MGCFQSKEDAAGAAPRPAAASKEREVAQLKKLVWRSEEPLDAAALQVPAASCPTGRAPRRGARAVSPGMAAVGHDMVPNPGLCGVAAVGRLWPIMGDLSRSHLVCRCPCRQPLPARLRRPPQRKREEFWDTQPYYGGSRGAAGSACPCPCQRHPFHIANSRRGRASVARVRRGLASCFCACSASGLPGLRARSPPIPPPCPKLQPRAEIWDALKAACASDPEMAKVLLDAAEVKVRRGAARRRAAGARYGGATGDAAAAASAAGRCGVSGGGCAAGRFRWPRARRLDVCQKGRSSPN